MVKPYSETLWVNNSSPAISANNLKKIEKGILNNNQAVSELETDFDKNENLLDYQTILNINKLDPNTILSSSNIENNSSYSNYGEVISGDYKVSDFISVTSGDTVAWYNNNSSTATTVSKATMFRIAQYDQYKQVISVSANWVESPFTTGSSTKYVRVVMQNRALNMVVLNESSSSLTYVEYEDKSDFVRIAKLDNNKTLVEYQTSFNKWNPNKEAKNYTISNSANTLGELEESSGKLTSDFFPAIKGQIISHYYSNDNTEPSTMAIGSSVYRLAEYDKDMNCLGVYGNWVTLPYTVANNNTCFVRLALNSIQKWNLVIINDDNIYQKPFVAYKEDFNLLSDIYRRVNSLQADTEIILPSFICGVDGQEINIYKENLVLNNRLKNVCYIHTRMSNDAYQDEKRTVWNPTTDSLKENNQKWEIMYNGLQMIDRKTIKECIVPKNTGSSSIKVLIIGDSKVDNGVVSYHFLHNFDDDNMTCTLLGSKYDWSQDNRNEGWGGKTAKWFCTNASSPLSNNGVCDFAHYQSAYSIDIPDYVFINLGTNDCSSLSGGTNTYITEFITYITQMITSIHSVSSNIVVIVGLCEGCSTVKDTNNAEFDKWDLNQKISNLHKATISAFDNRQNENIYVCPMYMGMDLTQDYGMTEVPLSKRDGDVNNGEGNGKTRWLISDHIHQSEVGYWKNADYMYALVKYIVAKQSS